MAEPECGEFGLYRLTTRWSGRPGAAADLVTGPGCPIGEVEVVLGRVYST